MGMAGRTPGVGKVITSGVVGEGRMGGVPPAGAWGRSIGRGRVIVILPTLPLSFSNGCYAEVLMSRSGQAKRDRIGLD